MELRIKEILKEQGITNISLADQVGITRPNMSNIVNGKTKPSLDTLERIAVILGVPFTDLFEQPKQNVITCPHCNGKIKIEKG